MKRWPPKWERAADGSRRPSGNASRLGVGPASWVRKRYGAATLDSTEIDSATDRDSPETGASVAPCETPSEPPPVCLLGHGLHLTLFGEAGGRPHWALGCAPSPWRLVAISFVNRHHPTGRKRPPQRPVVPGQQFGPLPQVGRQEGSRGIAHGSECKRLIPSNLPNGAAFNL